MIIDASELYDQFEQGFEQYGSTYSPDFHGMSDLSQAKARQVNGWADGLACDDFALAHFTALHRLSQLGYREQDPSSFDPNAFALKVLHGYEAFSTPDDVYASDEKLKIDEMARQGVHTDFHAGTRPRFRPRPVP